MKIIAFALLTIMFFQTNAQVVAIENQKLNVAYIGLDNPLIITVANVACSSLLIKVDNGHLEKKGDCNYNFRPQQIGGAKISISLVEHGDTTRLAIKNYRVKRIPDPTALIAMKSNGTIRLATWKMQEGIVAPILNFDISALSKVVSFEFRCLRNGKIIGFYQNKGAKFSKEIQMLKKKMRIGDEILIEKVMAKVPGTPINIEINDIYLKVI